MIDYNQIFEENYQKLNTQQKQAVEAIDGPVMVVAGPGSGKTQLLSMRVANIIRQTDTPASSVLCLTFTEAAAFNMRERLANIISKKEAYKVAIHTFHSFANEIINSYPELFFEGAQMNPADDVVQAEIFQEIFESLPKSNPLSSFHPTEGWTYLGDVKNIITDLKKGGLTPDEYSEILEKNKLYYNSVNPKIANILKEKITNKNLIQVLDAVEEILEESDQTLTKAQEYLNLESYKDFISKTFLKMKQEVLSAEKISTKYFTAWKNKFLEKNKDELIFLKDSLRHEKLEVTADIYKKYLDLMHRKQYYDFEDMILQAVLQIERNPSLKYELQEKFLYILVDEFQDTNGLQMRFIKNLYNLELTESKPNIMVVGDDDQSIFKFQGATLDNILNFQNEFREVVKISLVYNYRSLPDLVKFNSKIIEALSVRLSDNPNFEKEIVSARV